ncbi:MAG TPA: hypothetical protein VFR18_17935 [Terriglobia bacterium]|nr:hypothetical protein [Terriglobia bacterium]
MKRVLAMLMLVPAALFAGGLQGGQTAPKPGMAMMSCPMSLQGTSVTVADTATGVTVSITTKPENVADLRKRVEQMAAMHSGQSSSAAMMQGQMMPGTVKYEVIENGAKLTLTPRDSAKLAEFRTQVRAHVEKMQKGECSMMQDMMQGMMKGMAGTGKPEVKPEPKKDDVDHSAHHPEEKK